MATLKDTIILGNLSATGDIVAARIIKNGGTGDQLLCADGTTVGIINGGGLTIEGSPGSITVGHSNSVTAVETNSLLKFKYDAYGHITGSAAIAKTDITGLGIPDKNTTYTFEDGTNCFTVTPSGGSAQTVNVTPSIENNITGSGSNNYIAKFNGTNTITSGPALSSTNTSKFLCEDGTWEYPKFIQTRKSKTSSDWYGTSYPIYGFWETNTICKITVDNYSTKVDYATKDGDGNVITDTYAKKANGVYYVEGNTTGTAGTWTGTNTDIESYYDGLVVNYKIGIAGASTTKLNINELGAKTCYLRENDKKITTHYAVGTMVLLSYNSTTDAFYSADYDANDLGVRVYRQTSGYDADYPILVSRTKTAEIANVGINNSYGSIYAVIANDGANTPTINPHNGIIKAKGAVLNGANAVTTATQSVIDLGRITTSISPTDSTLNAFQTAGVYRFTKESSTNTENTENWLMIISTYPNSTNSVVQLLLNCSGSAASRIVCYRRVLSNGTWTVSTGTDLATISDIGDAKKMAGAAQIATEDNIYLIGATSQNPYGALTYTDIGTYITTDRQLHTSKLTGVTQISGDELSTMTIQPYRVQFNGYAVEFNGNQSVSMSPTNMQVAGTTNFVYGTSTVATQAWVTSNFVAKCLLEGTKISMADGTQKNIEEIQSGDLIKSINIETGEETQAVVLHIQMQDVKNEMTQLVFEDGSVLKTNGTHDIYDATKGTWVLSDWDLELDDEILKEDGSRAKFIGTYDWVGATKGRRYHFYDIITSNNCYYADKILCAHNPIRQFTWLDPVMNRYANYIPEELKEIVSSYRDENARENDLLDNEEYMKESINLFIKQRKKEKQLGTIKSKLAETDYVTIKSSEGVSITPKMQQMINSRTKWREEFNIIEKELQEVYTETNELKFKYSSLQEEVLLPRIDLRRKFFLESCRLGNEHLQDFINFYHGVISDGSETNNWS